jgi:hypothetical protein
MRVFMFLLAVALMTGGTLVVRASAENIKEDVSAPQVQEKNDLPEAAKPKRKLYA